MNGLYPTYRINMASAGEMWIGIVFLESSFDTFGRIKIILFFKVCLEILVILPRCPIVGQNKYVSFKRDSLFETQRSILTPYLTGNWVCLNTDRLVKNETGFAATGGLFVIKMGGRFLVLTSI